MPVNEKITERQTNLIGLTQPELEELARGMGEPAYRGRQLYHAVYAKKIFDFSRMTDLSVAFRNRLAENFQLQLPTLHSQQKSNDGTIKMLLALVDGEKIECVYIPEERRDTLCISSQVGCAVGCTFCATATMGLRRNMTAGEIVGQALYAIKAELIRKAEAPDGPERERGRVGERVRRRVDGVRIDPSSESAETSRYGFNIVMMGMGEPLHNFEQVARAIRILCDPAGMAVSHRKITLSTSGVVSGLLRLAQEPVIPNLAISLNAADDRTRTEIMPINKKWNIEALLDACRQFPLDSRRRITFEYVLLAGVNDSEEDARQLARLLAGLRAKVNLIAWNFNADLPFKTPPSTSVDRFKEILEASGLSAFLRKPRGADIYAACGQLALQS
ncbi:MAG TPA: 23S rRNA (adenine(2503)-C(2))-methyltransferase RlmN [Acidobacteriota bacterium]|jgi:23S rRNA (adenine2503-C2)-methyltransferase